MNKYKLSEEILEINGHILHRIIALRSFGNVNKGELGGWIEKESNLSHEGDCWIYNDAAVYGNAKIQNNVTVYDNVMVYDNAIICDNASIYGNVNIFDNAMIFGNTKIYDFVEICGVVSIYGNTIIRDNAIIYVNVTIDGCVEISNDVVICGNAKIGGNAVIKDKSDYIVFKNWWSSGRYFTWTRSNNMWQVGCFYGTGEELITKAYNDSAEKGREYKRIVKYVESIKSEIK